MLIIVDCSIPIVTGTEKLIITLIQWRFKPEFDSILYQQLNVCLNFTPGLVHWQKGKDVPYKHTRETTWIKLQKHSHYVMKIYFHSHNKLENFQKLGHSKNVKNTLWRTRIQHKKYATGINAPEYRISCVGFMIIRRHNRMISKRHNNKQ